MQLRIRILFYAIIAVALFSAGTYLGAALAQCTVKPSDGTIDKVLDDVNGDGIISCIDRSIYFYEMARIYGMNPRLIYGESQDGTTSHMWVRINGVDIEPFAYKSVYFKPDKYRYRLLDLTAYRDEMCRSNFSWQNLFNLPKVIRLVK